MQAVESAKIRTAAFAAAVFDIGTVAAWCPLHALRWARRTPTYGCCHFSQPCKIVATILLPAPTTLLAGLRHVYRPGSCVLAGKVGVFAAFVAEDREHSHDCTVGLCDVGERELEGLLHGGAIVAEAAGGEDLEAQARSRNFTDHLGHACRVALQVEFIDGQIAQSGAHRILIAADVVEAGHIEILLPAGVFDARDVAGGMRGDARQHTEVVRFADEVADLRFLAGTEGPVCVLAVVDHANRVERSEEQTSELQSPCNLV